MSAPQHDRRAPSQFGRRLAMILAVVASVVYLTYRATYTLALGGWFEGAFSLTLYAAEVYGCGLMFLYFFQIWDLRDPAPVAPLPGRSVDIYIPTYNEDPDLLRGTIAAALAVRYPHRTYVLDDGDRPAVRKLCEELGADYIRRDDNLHAKAGNINHAMELTTGEFVIILDADHVAEQHFIDRTLGYFSDEKLAFVQTPHAFYNYDSFQSVLNYGKGIYWEEGQLFYNCTQPGKNRWNAVSFCGSAAIFRRKALETVGLIATESITEDLHTGLRLHSKGWNSLFVNERLISGQAAPDVATFHSQRLRWGEGNLGVMFFDNPATMKGLTLPQRLCYIGSMLCWTTGVQKLVLYGAPILMLFTGVAPVAELSWNLATVTGCYLAAVWTGVKAASGGYGRLIAVEMTAMACFWTQVRSCWRATFGRAAAKFVVTNKRGGGGGKSVLRELRPQLVLIAAGAAAVAWAGARILCGVSGDVTGFLIGSFLVLVQSLFAWEIVRRGLKQADRRYSWRHPVAAYLEWSVPLPGGGRRSGTGVTCDVSELGVGFLAFEELPSPETDDDGGRDPRPAAVGSPVSVIVSAAGRTFSAGGKIRSVRKLTDEKSTKGLSRAYRYGVKFDAKSLSTADLDAVWDLGVKYGVTRQYERFSTGVGLGGRVCCPPADGEAALNLPVTLRFLPPVVEEFGNDADGEFGVRAVEDAAALLADRPAEVTVTETLGPDSAGLLLPDQHAAGTTAEVRLETPGGPAHCWAGVADSWPVRVGGRTLFAHRLTFRKFAGQGRGVVGGLVHRSDRGALKGAVRLSPAKLPKPVVRPAAAAGGLATLAAGLLLAVGLGLHRDDYLMTHVAAAGEASPGEMLRLRDLADGLRADGAAGVFDETRLLRLRRAFTAIGEAGEVDGLNELLVANDPQTPEGKFRRAESLMNLGRTDDAEAVFAELLADLPAFDAAWTRREVAVAAARSAAHRRQWETAAGRFETYLKLGGELDPVRAEWAGLLAQAGDAAKAVRVLTGGGLRRLDAMPTDERHLLAPLQLAAGDTGAAADTYRSLLKDDPADSVASLGLARVALDAGEGGAAEAFRTFLAAHPDDADARLGLAQSLLADGEPAAAEQALRELLADDPVHPELWPVYLSILEDAATAPRVGAKPVDPETRADRRRVLRAIAEHRAERAGDGGFLLQLVAAARRASDADPAGGWGDLLTDVRTDFVALPAPTPTAELRRAEALTDLARHAEAAEALDALWDTVEAEPAALSDAADRLALRTAAARSAARDGRFTVAADRFDAAVAAGVDPATVRSERAGTLAELDRPTDGVAVLLAGLPADDPFAPMTEQTEPTAPPLTRDERVQLGGLLAASGDLAGAARTLAAVVAESPDDRPAVRLLADVNAGLDRFGEAAALYDRVVALDPAADRADGDAAARAAAFNRLWSGDPAGAEVSFRRLLTAGFERPDLWTPYLEAVGELRSLPTAAGPLIERFWDRRAERAGDDRFLTGLVAAVHRTGRSDRVVALLADLTARPGTPPELLAWLADSLQEQGRYGEAAKVYARLLDARRDAAGRLPVDPVRLRRPARE